MNIWIFGFWNNCIQQYNFETFPSLCCFKACVTFCSLRPPVASLSQQLKIQDEKTGWGTVQKGGAPAWSIVKQIVKL
jgi:hypothetical protein